MNRRALLGTVAATSLTAVAGCLGGDGELVDETISEGMIYDLSLEEGTTIVIELENVDGDAVSVSLRDPDGGSVLGEATESSDTFEYDVEESGEYQLQVTPVPEGAEASVTVTEA